jgi:hypothetical protein
MPYKIRYQVNIDFVPPGRGLGVEMLTATAVPGYSGGEAQTINFQDSNAFGSNTFTSADITALLASMSADLSTQMNAAATLARIQAFASGGG